MTQPTRSHETVERLKELLFEQESREIGSLSDRIAEVQQRAGSDDNFRRAVAAALEQALEEVEQRRPKEISAAMAPMVLRTLRTEIDSPEMRDRIAGVMYPRMGEMVKRYVASAVRDMMQEINNRLEQSSFGQSRFYMLLSRIATGQSRVELAMAAAQRLDVVEMYLVRRGSGALVHHWQRANGLEGAIAASVPEAVSPAGRGGNRDVLVSGFLAAITAFAEEAFEARKESLRTLDLDEHRIYLRGSPDYLLAAKCGGTAPAGVEAILDAELLSLLGQIQASEQAPAGATSTGATSTGTTSTGTTSTGTLAAGSTDSERHVAYDGMLEGCADGIEGQVVVRVANVVRRQRMAVLRLISVVLALPLMLFGGWYGWVSWVTRDVTQKAQATLAEIPQLKGYPVRTHVERGGGRIWVSGLVPDEATRHQVLGRLQAIAPLIAVDEAVSVLPKPDFEARVGAEALRRALERARHRIEVVSGDVATALQHTTNAAEHEALEAASASLRVTIGELGNVQPAAASAGQATAMAEKLAALKGAADRLAVLAGIDAPVQLPAPRDATETAEALVLVVDRVGALISALEQKRAVAGRIDTVDVRLVQRIAELEQRLEAMRPAPPTARERLVAFVRDNAIFFGNDVDYRDAAGAAKMLDALVPLMREAGVAVRVVGYTDETGTAARNSPLAQSRADKVTAELVQRGAPRQLLVAVGRANGSNLAPGTGADSPNRRVEFEIAFSGEQGGRP